MTFGRPTSGSGLAADIISTCLEDGDRPQLADTVEKLVR